jgi:WD40 repeat protein
VCVCGGTLEIRDLDTAVLRHSWDAHAGSIREVALNSGGKWMVSSDESTLKMWDMETGLLLRTLKYEVACPKDLTVSFDGRRVVFVSDYRTLITWDLQSDSVVSAFTVPEVKALAVGPDGKWAVSGSLDNTLKVWDLEAGLLVRTLKGHSNLAYALASTPDGSRIVSGSEDHTLKVWDVVTGSLLSTFAGHTAAVYNVGISPNGKWRYRQPVTGH